MDTKLIVSASPHVRSEETTQSLMANVIVALCPCVVASAIIFGVRALLVTAVSVVACVAFEWLYCKLLKQPKPHQRPVRRGHRHHSGHERARGYAHRPADHRRSGGHRRCQAAVRRHWHELCKPRSGGPYRAVYQLCRFHE